MHKDMREDRVRPFSVFYAVLGNFWFLCNCALWCLGIRETDPDYFTPFAWKRKSTKGLLQVFKILSWFGWTFRSKNSLLSMTRRPQQQLTVYVIQLFHQDQCFHSTLTNYSVLHFLKLYIEIRLCIFVDAKLQKKFDVLHLQWLCLRGAYCNTLVHSILCVTFCTNGAVT